MEIDYKKISFDLFNSSSKQRIALVKNYIYTKPKLLLVVASLSKDLDINYDKKTILLNNILENNIEIEPELNSKTLEKYPSLFNQLYTNTKKIINEDVVHSMIFKLIDTYIDSNYRKVEKQKNSDNFKGELLAYRFPEHIFEDVCFAIDQFFSDELYSIYGLDKKEQVIKKFKNDIKDIKNISFSKLETELSQYIQKMPTKKVSLKQDSILFLKEQEFKGCKIIIPQSNTDLVEAGLFLNICVGNGSYTIKINEKKCFVLFLKKDQLDYCIELDRKLNVIQFKTYHNKNASDEVIKEFEGFVKKLKPSIIKSTLNTIKKVFYA